MADIDRTRLSKRMSYALRHHPEELGLALAADGSVPAGELVAALNGHYGWPRPVTEADVAGVVARGSKRRFALDGGRVRALYGHSVAAPVEHEEAEPPAVLYHGTSHAAWASIQEEGLLPMGRQTVHLSAGRARAARGRRRRGVRRRGPLLARQRGHLARRRRAGALPSRDSYIGAI